MEPLNYEKRGYLNESFRLFHLADGSHQEIAYHYHTFHKIIILLAGRAGYAIEGEGYALQPGDYVLVGRGSIHRPIVEQGDFYERAILYISPEFLQELLSLFEAVGLEDPWVAAQRRRLSLILFG